METDYVEIKDLLQGVQDKKDYLELSLDLNLGDVVERVGEEEVGQIAKAIQVLDDTDKAIVWSGISKALNMNRPEPKYNGLLLENDKVDIFHNYFANYNEKLEYQNYYLPNFLSMFDRLYNSPIVKSVFFVIDRIYKEKEYMEFQGLSMEKDLSNERDTMVGNDEDDGFYTYFIDIIDYVFPYGYDNDIANIIFDTMLEDDLDLEGVEHLYFIDGLDKIDDVDLTFVVRDRLKDFFEYVLD